MKKLHSSEQNLSPKDRKICGILTASYHDTIAMHDAMGDFDAEWRNKGTKSSIIRRLQTLGWAGIKEGMNGCYWPPEPQEWAAYLGAPQEDIPWGPERKARQIPEGPIRNRIEALCSANHNFQQNRAFLRFYELLEGHPANCEPYSRWTFMIWRRDSVLRQCIEESKAVGLGRETDLEKLRVDFEQRDGPRISQLPGSLDDRLEEFQALDADIRSILGDDCPIPPIDFTRAVGLPRIQHCLCGD